MKLPIDKLEAKAKQIERDNLYLPITVRHGIMLELCRQHRVMREALEGILASEALKEAPAYAYCESIVRDALRELE